MKTQKILLLSLLSFLFINLYQTHALSAEFQQDYLKNLYGHSVDCVNPNLGISFYCNPNWKIKSTKKMMTTTISTYPNVIFTVEKTNSRMGFLSQINQLSLESMNLYAKGFGTEHIKIAGRETLKIKAFSKKNPDIRLADYYLIHDLTLYRISFLVNDKDAWDKYKFLIKSIIESLDFVDKAKK